MTPPGPADFQHNEANTEYVRAQVNAYVFANDVRDLGRLDPEAIAQVRSEAWPVVRDADELHDTLLSAGAFPEAEGSEWREYFDELSRDGRTVRREVSGGPVLWIAVEQWPAVNAAVTLLDKTPPVTLPDSLRREVTIDDARMLLVRGRLEISGPTTAKRISTELGMELNDVQIALEQLENQGHAHFRAIGPLGQHAGALLIGRVFRYPKGFAIHIKCEANCTAGVFFPNNFSHIRTPNPDKPELNIEYCRLKIYCIASL